MKPERHHRRIRRKLARANASLILVTTAITLAVVYGAIGAWLDQRSDESVNRELDRLVSHHQEGGPSSLSLEIERRLGSGQQGGYVYVFTESREQRVVGNLPGWPEGLEPDVRDRRLSVQVTTGRARSLRRVDVASKALPDGQRLLVGRDVSEDERLMGNLAIVMAGAFAIATVIAIAGGLSISRRLLGRVEGMNVTVLGILEGRRRERVPHDDSVCRIMAGKPRMLRRARGYAPAPLRLPHGFSDAPDILAMGAELKNTFCLTREGKAVISQHMGDLEEAATFVDFRHNLDLYRSLFDHAPRRIAVDLHPDYLSTKHGVALADAAGLPVEGVQHHHAHIAACMAEQGVPLGDPAVLGVALDGLGFGGGREPLGR